MILRGALTLLFDEDNDDLVNDDDDDDDVDVDDGDDERCSDPALFPLSWNHTTPQWHTPSSSVMRILQKKLLTAFPSPIL